MANTRIQIRRSTSTATPPGSSLSIAEQAYSYSSNTLYIGGSDGVGVLPIGGKHYVDQQSLIFDLANASYNYANAIAISSNTAQVSATMVAAYNQANAAYDHASLAYDTANTSLSKGFLRLSNSSTTLDGTTANIWGGSFSSSLRDTFSGIYNSNNTNMLFTFASGGSNVASIQADGSLFVGEGFVTDAMGVLPSYGGWIVAASGIKSAYTVYAGSDLQAGGKVIVGDHIQFADGTKQYTANAPSIVSQSAFNNANAAFDKANSANVLAYNTGIGANSYADSVGTASNNYTNSVGLAGNNYTNAVGAASNSYADFVGTASNNYTNTVGAAGNNYASILAANNAIGANGWANTVATAGNNYTNSVGTAGNNYMLSVATAGNNYTDFVGASSNTYANNTFVKLVAPSQTITGDLAITGNLTFLGNSTVISSNSLSVGDSLIYLAANNYSGTDLLDIGFVANYANGTGANVHTGLIRDATTKEYYLFQGLDIELQDNNTAFTPGSNGAINAILHADINADNITLSGMNVYPWIVSAFNTANSSNGWANTVGAASNSYTDSVGTAGNNYTNSVGTAGNNYMLSVATAGNNYMLSVATAGNNYTDYVGTSANSYALSTATSIGTAGNNYTNYVGASANSYADYVGASANSYALTTAQSIGTAGNNYMLSVATAGNNYTNYVGTSANSYAAQVGAAANTNAANASYISTGTLAVSYGGTGNTTFTTNGILFGNGTGPVQVTGAGTEGQVLTAGATGVPSFQHLDGGTF